MYSQADIEFTKTWWANLLKDEVRLTKWLQKLQRTEIGGFYDYQAILNDDAYKIDERTQKIFVNIALDEFKHSNLLLDLFEARKIEPAEIGAPETISSYWTQMNERIISVDTFCAVNYYGEGLAAFRFEIIQAHPNTPADIKFFIDQALPDEQFHRETLKRLSSEESLAAVAEVHTREMNRLKGV